MFLGATGLSFVTIVLAVHFEMPRVSALGMYTPFGLVMYLHFVLRYGNPLLFGGAVALGLFYAGRRLASLAGYETPTVREVE